MAAPGAYRADGSDMSKRRSRNDTLDLILGAAIIAVTVAIWVIETLSALDVLIDYWWLMLLLFVVGVGPRVFQFLRLRRADRRLAQERRDAIVAHREAWGDEICAHLMATGKRPDDLEVTRVLSHLEEWGAETCLVLLRQAIGPGMTGEMVRAALGEPDTVENRDTGASGVMDRWTYGAPGDSATHIWLRNDEVVRVAQETREANVQAVHGT